MQSLNIIPTLSMHIPVLMGSIAHLHNEGYAPASIITTVSASSYFHKVNGFQNPAKNPHFQTTKRLLVTLPILAQLIRAVPLVLSLQMSNAACNDCPDV